MKKRVVSILLLLCMALTMLPAPGLGEEAVSLPGQTLHAYRGADEESECLHEKDAEGYCTADGCTHNADGHDCCPLRDTRIVLTRDQSMTTQIQKSYDGTTQGYLRAVFYTDGTNRITLTTEGSEANCAIAAVYDTPELGQGKTVTVTVTLTEEMARRYCFRNGATADTFTTTGDIEKIIPPLSIGLRKTEFRVGERLYPSLALIGVMENAEVTYRYANDPAIAGPEFIEINPRIDENTAISLPGDYWVYATTTETENFKANYTSPVKITVRDYCTVTFNPNGGYVRPEEGTKKVAWGKKYGELPVPTREGFDFDGWYMAAEGGSQIYATDRMPANIKRQTLYAHWNEHGADNDNDGFCDFCDECVHEKDENGCAVVNCAHKAGGLTCCPRRALITPVLTPPTVEGTFYAFDSYGALKAGLTGGEATVDGVKIEGTFAFDENENLYGFPPFDDQTLRGGELTRTVVFTPADTERYASASCTVTVTVHKLTVDEIWGTYIDITNKKIGTPFSELGLSNDLSFYALRGGVRCDSTYQGAVVWNESDYDPNEPHEQTITGTLAIIEAWKDNFEEPNPPIKTSVKVKLQYDPVTPTIVTPPVFRWSKGDFQLGDNRIFVGDYLETGTTKKLGEADATAELVGGEAQLNGQKIDGTFALVSPRPKWTDHVGAYTVKVIFTPEDTVLYAQAECTIDIEAIKRTVARVDYLLKSVTDKPVGTAFEDLEMFGMASFWTEDGSYYSGVNVTWDESTYDPNSEAEQIVTGALNLGGYSDFVQQPSPELKAEVRVKLLNSHIHAYTQKIQKPEALKTPADCLSDAVYYLSCACGAVSTDEADTFIAQGTALDHDWAAWTQNADRKTHTRVCRRDASHTETGDCRGGAAICDDCKAAYGEAAEREYSVEVRIIGMPEWGTVTPMKTKARAGEKVTLTATPTKGNAFKEWVFLNEYPGGGGYVNPVLTFTMPAEDVVYQAHFTVKYYSVSWQTTELSSGSAYYVTWGNRLLDILARNPKNGDLVFTGWKYDDPNKGPKDGTIVTEEMTYGDLAGEDTVPALRFVAQWHEHKFNLWTNDPKTLKSPADCTHNAVYYWQCLCGLVERNDEHTYEMENTALGHTWAAWTQNEDGKTHTRVCTRDASHTETGDCHGGQATCIAQAICEDCKAAYGGLAAHSYGTEWKTNRYKHWHECTVCGAETERMNHSDSDDDHLCDTCDKKMTEHDFTAEKAEEKYLKAAATCQSPAVYCKSCTICGAQGTETFEQGGKNPDNHTGTLGDWQHDADSHWKVYSCCQAEALKAAHAGGQATCTAQAVCEDCRAAYGEALDHNWLEDWGRDTDKHWHECARCHEKKDAAEHDFGEGDACVTCGYQRAHVHRLTFVQAQEATCTQDGHTAYYTCSGCSAWFKDATGSVEITDKNAVILPTGGHAFGSWQSDAADHWKVCGKCLLEADRNAHNFEAIVDRPAAEGVKGEQHEECTVCGYSKEPTEIPALPIIITHIDAKITAPALGEKASFTAAFTTQPERSVGLELFFWYMIPADQFTGQAGDRWLPMPEEDSPVFQTGYYYAVELYAGANDGYVFADSVVKTVNGQPHDTTYSGNGNETSAYLAFVFAPLTEHTHAFGAWHSDETDHWRECACGEQADKAPHTESGWMIDRSATETEAGSRHTECTVCGRVLRTEEIPATGHAFGSAWKSDETDHWHECAACGEQADKAPHTESGWFIDREATETEAGGRHTECAVCGRALRMEEIPATGHAFGSAWHSDETDHWRECACGEQADKAPHTESGWMIDRAATETEAGGRHTECTVCGRVLRTEEIPATGHAFGDWQSDETDHWHECATCGEQADKAPHEFKWVIDRRPTAAQKGSRHEECIICGHQRAAVEIPATGASDVPKTGDRSYGALGYALLASVLGLLGAACLGKKKRVR